ncbi:MAG: heparinase II/III family protein, partial [Clostridia bacterium]|nr:heparinase II/III family protein [Clostridia bacterium]
DIFVANELENAEGTYPWPQNVWFPGIQVMAARREEGSCKGLYLSAKGGTNGESHNHNDVGAFVVYCDGKPAIIDIGTGEYTKQTFSAGRYEIPQINSYYHNLPIIGGEGQLPGVQYTAQDVTYTCDEMRVDFGVELRGVYPESAGVESWKRSFLYDRAAGAVTVADDFALTEEKDVQLVLITKPEPVFAPGEMTLVLDEESTVTASFDPTWVPATEFFPTGHDANLTKSWGTDGVYRTVFTLPGKVKSGSHAFIIRKK